MTDIANRGADGNSATCQEEPDYLAIHNPTSVQLAQWDDWALQAAEMLERHGWIRKRIGAGLHMQHPFFLGGEA